MANTHRRRDSTVELSRVGVGAVYWAIAPLQLRVWCSTDVTVITVYYIRQEVLRSVVFVCLFVGWLVLSFVRVFVCRMGIDARLQRRRSGEHKRQYI